MQQPNNSPRPRSLRLWQHKPIHDKWVSVAINLPPDWGREYGYNPDGFYRVRLVDGREINTRWDERGFSVERLKPNLKVAYWRRPELIA